MERRRALAVAGSLTITAFAGAVAAGASTGLFGLGTIGGAATPSGSLAPVTRPAAKVVEITVPARAPGAAANSTGRSGAPAPAASTDTGSTAPLVPSVQSAGQESEREVHQQETYEPREHEDEHEGRGDDD